MYIFPYNAGSQSVRNLRAAKEDLRIIRRENSRFRGSADKIVVNWGCSQLPEEVMKSKVVNHPDAVAIAANKRDFFNKVKDVVSIPPFTENVEEAFEWLNKGHHVVVREKLNGHSGEGIVILENQFDFEDYDHTKARVYVQYVPKKDEYRIHVSNGEVIDMQRKAMQRGLDREQVNWKVRNHRNGFVFVREGVEPPEEVIEQAKLAVKTVGLDFGAVDVIWNNHYNKAYVLEINTAPGLEGKSVDTYAKALEDMAQFIVALNPPQPLQRPHNVRINFQPQPFDLDEAEF